MQINENYQKLPGSYLFSEIARRTALYSAEHPDRQLIRLGIGDVTLPLPEAAIQGMQKALEEMGNAETFRGYGPEQGYDFLRNAVVLNDYELLGVEIEPDEVFISDGAKSDCGNITDLFGPDNIVAVCDPVYPVYVDTNAMDGRAGVFREKSDTWSKLVYMPCTAETGFLPEIPKEKVDLIYLCFPNNPTGSVANREQLKAWVDYANEHESLILFDGAYEAFITEPDIPHSIFEISGATTCAIEFRSFSKTAGFTGVRCAYTVVPKDLVRDGASLNQMWNRRQSTKFNGVSYITQRGAQAVYSQEGKEQVRANIQYYLNNARVIFDGLQEAGLVVSGGINSPYVWCETPEKMGSWEFFDRILEEANVVTTPGAGFGPSGEGYIRLTGFGNAEETKQAVQRIQSIL